MLDGAGDNDGGYDINCGWIETPKEILVNRNHDTCFHSGSGQWGIAFTGVN